MPFYDYKCEAGHQRVKLRKMSDRHEPIECAECGKNMSLIISLVHRQPDGIYSYEPNIGNKDTFDRRWETSKAKKLLSDGT